MTNTQREELFAPEIVEFDIDNFQDRLNVTDHIKNLSDLFLVDPLGSSTVTSAINKLEDDLLYRDHSNIKAEL